MGWGRVEHGSVAEPECITHPEQVLALTGHSLLLLGMALVLFEINWHNYIISVQHSVFSVDCCLLYQPFLVQSDTSFTAKSPSSLSSVVKGKNQVDKRGEGTGGMSRVPPHPFIINQST